MSARRLLSHALTLAGLFSGAVAVAPWTAGAGEYFVAPIAVEDRKSVFGRVESRDLVPARARIGGSVLSIDVDEGSAVSAGQVIAVIGDEKLRLRLDANNAAVRSLMAQLENARTEFDRNQRLFDSGVIAKARLDQLRTQVDVLTGQLGSANAERAVVVQQAKEGQVLSPTGGRVLRVPVTANSVVMAGDTVATVAGGGYFLRLALPERHAARIAPGDAVLVGARGIDAPLPADGQGLRTGRLVKVYPQIENGQVLADVEVDGLGDFFVGERTLVWIAIDKRQILAVPPTALAVRSGIDYVRLTTAQGPAEVAVVAGQTFETAGGPRVEILSGLAPGDRVVVP